MFVSRCSSEKSETGVDTFLDKKATVHLDE